MTRDEIYDGLFDCFYKKVKLFLSDGKTAVGVLRNIYQRGDNDDVEGYEDKGIYLLILPNGTRCGYDEDEVVGFEVVE